MNTFERLGCLVLALFSLVWAFFSYQTSKDPARNAITRCLAIYYNACLYVPWSFFSTVQGLARFNAVFLIIVSISLLCTWAFS
jgi:hypothetical protein